MIDNEYFNHNRKNNMATSLSIINNLIQYSSIGTGIGTMIWWGSGLNNRLKAMEDWRSEIEARQERIETKIDSFRQETTARIDNCKDTILAAITAARS